MRLLFLCTDMARGGAERQWATLIPALAERGAEVRLVCLNEEGELFDEVRRAGVPARCLGLRGRGDARALQGALAEAAGRPGAVVTRGVSPQLVGAALARLAGAALVLNEHTPLTPDGELLPLRPHQRPLTRAVAPLVDLTIAVTERQAEPLVRRGYCSDRIVTVPNGIFPGDATPAAAPAETRAALGLSDGDFAVLCVANLRPEKRADAFVAAITAARRTEPSVRGLLVGDGPERERIERLVERSDGVTLLGSRGDVPDLMAGTDALCLLSAAEALPMSILEAMALARPVVTTNVGGAAEAVAHGETGLVVAADEAGAALARLAADPAAARAMGERGRVRQLERFGGEAMVDGYWRALERVAAR